MTTQARNVRRKIKNAVNQFSEAEALVREATSNDPWGPSTSQMLDLADASCNPNNRKQIFCMLWKRVSDSSKNWRHVWKALVCWDYLLKVGHETVYDECQVNHQTFELLGEFSAIDPTNGADNGARVRKQAEEILRQLRDPEYYHDERAKATELARKFRSSGMMSSRNMDSDRSNIPVGSSIRPIRSSSSTGNYRQPDTDEEDRELQRALTLSKIEAEKEEAMREFERKTIQQAEEAAIQASLKEYQEKQKNDAQGDLLNIWNDLQVDDAQNSQKALTFGDPWATQPTTSNSATAPPPPYHSNDPWSMTLTQQLTNAPTTNTGFDLNLIGPGGSQNNQSIIPQSVFGPQESRPALMPGPSAMIGTSNPFQQPQNGFNATGSTQMAIVHATNGQNVQPFPGVAAPITTSNNDSSSFDNPAFKYKDPREFLGDHKDLVNMDSLVISYKPIAPAEVSAFGDTSQKSVGAALFAAQNTTPKVTLSQMSNTVKFNNNPFISAGMMNQPVQPIGFGGFTNAHDMSPFGAAAMMQTSAMYQTQPHIAPSSMPVVQQPPQQLALPAAKPLTNHSPVDDLLS